jgi:hypothetical protein
MGVAPPLVLTDAERTELTRLVRSRRTSVRLALRARTVLLAADGHQDEEIATELGTGRGQVARALCAGRLAGIERDRPAARGSRSLLHGGSTHPIGLGNCLLTHFSAQRTTEHGLSDLLGVLNRL